jgi:hypothetical protein
MPCLGRERVWIVIGQARQCLQTIYTLSVLAAMLGFH